MFLFIPYILHYEWPPDPFQMFAFNNSSCSLPLVVLIGLGRVEVLKFWQECIEAIFSYKLFFPLSPFAVYVHKCFQLNFADQIAFFVHF